VAGGTEQRIALAGAELNAHISGRLITFEHFATFPLANRDVYAYDVPTGRVYQLTDTPTLDESLNDVSVSANGTSRVVYQVQEAGNFNVYGFTFSLRTPAQMIADLVDKTFRFVGLPTLRAALRARLEEAAAALVQNRPALACTILDGYIQAVQVLAPRPLTAAQVAELVADARGIKAAIGCA
jgi:hypothetical protein